MHYKKSINEIKIKVFLFMDDSNGAEKKTNESYNTKLFAIYFFN